ncbi:XRE family transcriptional regulator [Pseudoalteromonas sp. A25]|uniref:helix-turn-helix domain-containing protein n=1 Tax=Pseudoalteromonas sp. A25 TaxID=116092 RepID=UPI001260FAD7|nr:helix-turn-helix domain-containing protein [Pseudoalteromonas sp. A25]BBN83694.1 XRE family transcriptional regulator [Pseudoalteromonas sp. A25]
MITRKLRLQRGWSQDQLAQLSGLSLRTIQRIERGHTPSLESLKSLAAVFETTVADLQQELKMKPHNSDISLTEQEQTVIEHVKAIRDFYSHALTYAIIIVFLFILNYITNPGYIWAWWAALGWGIGLASHGLSIFEVFDFFGPRWEKKQIEKRLGRKL